MPKKIKQEKETVYNGNKKQLINVNNIHIIFIILAIIAVCICVSVGVYVYFEDKNHPNKDNAIVDFTYTEKLDEGYNVYEISQTNTKQIFTEYNTLDKQEVKEISRGKYLDFNEEIYNSGLLEIMGKKIEDADPKWSIYVKFADGTRRYLYSHNVDSDGNIQEINIDKEYLNNVIKTYFNQEILYK